MLNSYASCRSKPKPHCHQVFILTSTEQPNVSETSKTTTQAETNQPAEKPVQTKTEPKPAPKSEDGFDSVDLSEFS